MEDNDELWPVRTASSGVTKLGVLFLAMTDAEVWRSEESGNGSKHLSMTGDFSGSTRRNPRGKSGHKKAARSRAASFKKEMRQAGIYFPVTLTGTLTSPEP